MRYIPQEVISELLVAGALAEDDSDISDTSTPPLYLYRDYSGRGMSGRGCLGLVGNHTGLANFFFALGSLCSTHEDEIGLEFVEKIRDIDLPRLIDDMCEDSFGSDIIFYFPRWTIGDE